MKKFFLFLSDYWWVVVLVLAAPFIILWLTGGRRPPSEAVKLVQAELDAVAARREARDMTLRLGHEAAKTKILEKYRDEREALEQVQADRVKELEDDPEKLAEALARLTGGR